VLELWEGTSVGKPVLETELAPVGVPEDPEDGAVWDVAGALAEFETV